MTVKLMSLSKNTDNSWKKGKWITYNRWPDMKVIPGPETKNYFLFGNHPISLADPRPACKWQSKKSTPASNFLADELLSAPGSKASEAGCLQ